MNKLYFTQDHEWVSIGGDNTATIGISNYAQKQLGDIVFVELPELNRKIIKGEDVAIVESVKSASDIKAPISGEVFEINTTLEDKPELINDSAMNEGWIFKVKSIATEEIESLIGEDEYENIVQNDNSR